MEPMIGVMWLALGACAVLLGVVGRLLWRVTQSRSRGEVIDYDPKRARRWSTQSHWIGP